MREQVGFLGIEEKRRRRQQRLNLRVAVLQREGLSHPDACKVAAVLESLTAAYHRSRSG